jgi:protein TonB
MKSLLLALLILLSTACTAQAVTTDSVYTKVDTAATYPGGYEAWSKFLMRNLRYPKAAQDNDIQGKVQIKFIVDRDGNVSNIEAISGPVELQSECIRLIRLTRRWIPAMLNGAPVKAYKIQDFRLKLEK